MDVDKGDLRLMLLCTFRYSLGRQTYMPAEAQRFVRQYAGALAKHDFKQLADEINEYVRTHGGSHSLGADFDQRDWYRFREWCRDKSEEG
jgi:hypothetical protein